MEVLCGLMSVESSNNERSIDELLDELHWAVYLFKLDSNPVTIKYEYNRRIFIRWHFTHDGHYKFLVMPFDLTNAPTTFH